MKILIIGAGGREHAIAWKISQSDQIKEIFVAPGNAGTQLENKVSNIDIQATDIPALKNFAKEQAIDLTIVGPEAPLCLGIVDEFEQENLLIFGPCQKAARLEASKAYSKEFMERYHIPTAQFKEFTESSVAIDYLDEITFPTVIKADGLAAGKGVVIAQTKTEAKQAIIAMLESKAFGEAGNKIVIEEFLSGLEASFILATDGKHVIDFVSTQDHKARDDFDKGPNTGGMGAYSPTPIISETLRQQIIETIVHPTLQGLANEGVIYNGFLFIGLMINEKGEAKVLEYNCRLGDPETEVILPRLKSDFVELCLKTKNQQLADYEIEWLSQSSLGVVLAAKGYPDHYEKGQAITGLENIADPNVKVFHAGTKTAGGQIVSNGGRLLCITALADDLKKCQKNAYQTINQLNVEHFHFRHDIGDKALKKT